jgi:transcriptional regulator with XRE-family HTH domain
MATKTVSAAIGSTIRHLREAAGRRQEDVASSARDLSLLWVHATVAALETGRRDLSIEEFLLLPRILQGAGIDRSLPDLLGEGSIALSPAVAASAEELRGVLAGSQPDDDWKPTVPGDSLAGAKSKYGADLAVINEARDDATLKAARRLGVEPIVIAQGARKLWGRSLAAERDERVKQGGSDAGQARTLQAHRGHVTRALLDELRQALTTKKKRKGRR